MSIYEALEILCERSAVQVSRGRRADGKRVVLKRLASNASPQARNRLKHEYGLLTRINLAGVIKPLGLEEADGGLHLVLEDIGGESLERLLTSNRKLAPERFLDLAIGVTETLSGLHRQRIVHKAIDPTHIILNSPEGEFRLIGFGSADELAQSSVSLQSPRDIEGNLAYIAPEQTGRMTRSVDYRADFYALGATFYRLLTGRPPFESEDLLGLVHKHIAVAPLPPHAIEGTIPLPLSRVVMKLLAKMAEDRYQSGEGLKADLERCRRGLAAGSLPDFEPGQEDFPEHLHAPEKLHGREAEIRRLLSAIERAYAGGRELLLVAGYAGVGKTALVHETHRLIAQKRGHFIEGKFDQLQRNVPYSSWIQAFSGLVRYLLMESDVRLAHWRSAIQAAVGDIGRVLTDIVPDLELVIGRQPEAPVLTGTEAQNRFNYVFLELVKVIATPEHPLAIFLDDLQWVDSASLTLLQTLLTNTSVENLLVIGAYRDNEVDALHPLTTSIEALCMDKAIVERITIGELTEESANELVAAALHYAHEQSLPLTRRVFARTGGNPFFLFQTLRALTERQALFFDFGSRRWNWDVVAIERMGIADNLVALMLERIRNLASETQHLLSLAACIGFRFSLPTLSAVAAQSDEIALSGLQPALREGLILAEARQYQFVHDRVREAAYSLIPPAERAAQHLQIGRLLLANTPEDTLTEAIFEIVGHLNQGIALITEPTERERLTELDLLAGRRAKTATAFAVAIEHFAAGMATLGPDAWETRHDLAFSMHAELAECEYQVGNFARSERLLDEALNKAHSLLDRALVYRIYQRLYQQSGRWPEAVNAALRGLELLGVSFPESDEEIRSATVTEKRQIQVNLHGRRVADLADVPLTDDAETQVMIGLLAEAITQFFITRPVLWHLIVLKCVNLCLERGHVAESPYVYSSYCKILVALYNDIPSAFEFSKMSLKLNERFSRRAFMKGLPLFFHASVVSIWCQHFATNLPLFDQAFQVTSQKVVARR